MSGAGDNGTRGSGGGDDRGGGVNFRAPHAAAEAVAHPDFCSEL